MFEISIVCHVLCSWFWRGGWGFSLFWGVVLACPSCFLGLLGFPGFLLVLLHVLGWVAGCGGFRGSGVGAPVSCSSFRGGWVWGCVCARPVPGCLVLAVVGVGWSGVGVRVLPGSRGGGRVVPGFLFVFAVLLSCSRGVFGCCFFRPVLSVFFWFPVLVFVVLPGVGGCGGCRVGFGVFSPASAVLARACLGLGWVLFGEFDPGSGRTLAACLTHASRTGPPLWGWVEWRTGEYHVSNLPPAPG